MKTFFCCFWKNNNWNESRVVRGSRKIVLIITKQEVIEINIIFPNDDWVKWKFFSYNMKTSSISICSIQILACFRWLLHLCMCNNTVQSANWSLNGTTGISQFWRYAIIYILTTFEFNLIWNSMNRTTLMIFFIVISNRYFPLHFSWF